MFELVFLGTSASAPSIHRGLSSTAVLAGEHRFLVDCGEGTQRQILRSGIGFKRLTNILLTHAHLDHILGLAGLVSTFTRWENIDELNIWGSDTVLDRVRVLIFEAVFLNQKPPVPITLHSVCEGEIFNANKFTVSAFPVEHRGRGCFGYVFEEKPHTPFLVEKAEALGVPVGPVRKRLVEGETVTLESGAVITPDMVLGEAIPGTKVVFTGDIGNITRLASIAQGADALVIEATFLETEADVANQFGHITAKQAATVAQEAGVQNLLIHHVSRRYRERDIVAEARAVFPEAIVTRDLDHFAIQRSQKARKIVDEQ